MKSLGPRASRKSALLGTVGAFALSLFAARWLMGCSDQREGSSAASKGPETKARAIVLVTVDGLVGSRLAPLGGDIPMPALESVSAEGTVLRDVWTACPMTRPSVATHLTGAAPDRHGVWDDLHTPLPPEAETLAEVLQEKGFTTAAFPGTSALAFSSGLWQGFEIVDEPASQPMGQFVASFKSASTLAADFGTWLAGVPREKSYFAWLHFAEPGRALLDGDSARYPAAVSSVDAALQVVFAAVRGHGDWAGATIVVAGTYGDSSGGENGVPGPGFSLDPRIVGVPVVFKWASKSNPVAPDRPTWSPDIPETLARLAGVSLPASEGVDLRVSPPGSRIRFAWTRATRDQMGWRTLGAASRAGSVYVDGIEDAPRTDDPAALGQALAQRPVDVAAHTIPVERVTALLAARGVQARAVPMEGRNFGPLAARREAATALWAARRLARERKASEAVAAYGRSLVADPEALAPLVEAAQVAGSPEQAAKTSQWLDSAAALYPWHPDAVHWFGHRIFSPSAPAKAEALWMLVVGVRQTDMDLLYDLACTRSLAGDLAASEDYLRKAIAAGFTRWVHIEADPDLRNLRASPRFASLMRELRK